MKNNITKDIEYMKYVLGYKRGVVISEQPIKKTSLSEQNNNEKPSIGCIVGDCESGDGTYKYSSGAEYTGRWEGGKRNGKGTNKYSSGAVYTGEWKDDKQDGPEGTFTSSKGTVYTGEFKDNKLLNGQVIYKLSNGNSRYGEWENGEQGELQDGEPPKCIDGDCENGTGTYKYNNKSTYTGKFKDGRFNGKGTETLLRDDNSIMFEYTGEFKNGYLFNGYSTHIHSDGTSQYREVKEGISGELIDGKPPEQNKTSELDNNVNKPTKGCITGDCIDGKGTYKLTDRDDEYIGEYTGEFKDGKRNGQGTCKFADGDEYTGQWEDGNRNGQGTYKFADVGVYTGEWKEDKINGQGIYTNINGVKSSGNWVDGKLNGKGFNDLDEIKQSGAQNNPEDCKEPTEPTHRYKNDKNYRYAKSGDCWWAKNINNNKWINLTELVKTKPKIQSSIDKLNDGTDLIKL